MIEFNKWYNPGAEMMQCLSCGALVVDTELHAKWHGFPQAASSYCAPTPIAGLKDPYGNEVTLYPIGRGEEAD